MVIASIAEIRRLGRAIAHSCKQALVCIACALSLGAGGAVAAPYAQPGEAFRAAHDWALPPLVRVGLCGSDDDPCPAYERAPVSRSVHTRRRDPEPDLPLYEERIVEERVVAQPVPDCVEERVAVRTHVVQETTVPLRTETYDEPCGVRCWYKRLRAGYCGRGCDYYRFRMTEFPAGPLGRNRVQVACR